VRLLREIAIEQGLALTTFSQGWIIRLEKGPVTRYVHGYNFELNSAAAQLLANDKSAVSDLMGFKNIPHVEHRLFLHPRLAGYVSGEGSWADLTTFAQQYNFKVVCKPNDGTGGEDVFRARSQAELEKVVQQLFSAHRAICLSPFYNIDEEYRLIFLGGNCELVYAKKRPAITGDGTSTVAGLIAKQMNEGLLPVAVAERAIRLNQQRLNEVLPAGTYFVLDWKHNLVRGAHPVIITDPGLLETLTALGQRCAAELNIRFASIDIIETEGHRLILEVNSGVMMEHFAHSLPDGYARAKAVYAKAVALMFQE
jgi:glutathione synthase/RimK-type ligase-like ATP-grasp enzyme